MVQKGRDLQTPIPLRHQRLNVGVPDKPLHKAAEARLRIGR